MPQDSAKLEIEVHAGLPDVLATIRDVGIQPEWVPAIKEAEVLEEGGDGLPLRARFAASTAVGTDRYTLAYEHSAHGMSWHLVEGRLQTGQVGRYTLRSAGPGATKVSYGLTIQHSLPLPGFIRSRVIEGLVADTLDGLKKRLEGPS